MTDLETRLYQNIQIVIQRKNVYLHNKSDEIINELTYETASMFTTDNVIAVSSIPKYQIRAIPPNQIVYLETLDGWEDGTISYYLIKIKTQTIDFQGNITLKSKQLSGIFALPQIANSAVVKLGSKDSFTIKIEEKNDKRSD